MPDREDICMNVRFIYCVMKNVFCHVWLIG